MVSVIVFSTRLFPCYLQLVKKIKAAGVNVLLIQKSILRDAVTDLSLHYLAKAKILVVKDIERDEIEFISSTLDCLPVAHVDHLRPEKLGQAGLVEEVDVGGGKLVKVTGVKVGVGGKQGMECVDFVCGCEGTLGGEGGKRVELDVWDEDGGNGAGSGPGCLVLLRQL